MQSFKEFMKEKRKSLNISFGIMAKELGYTSEQLYDIENGETKISLDFIEKIQKIFVLNEVEMQELKDIISNLSQHKASKGNAEIQVLQQRLKHSIFNTPHPKVSKENTKIQNLKDDTSESLQQEFKRFMQMKRWELGIDRKEMAIKLDYDIGYFYSIENGRDRIPFDFVERMEQVFKLNFAELKELYSIVIELQNKLKIEKIENKQKFEQFITKKLNDLGITKAEMIERLGCSPSHIYHVGNGRRNISLNFIEKLQKVFNLNEAELKELHQMRKENKKVKKQTNKIKE